MVSNELKQKIDSFIEIVGEPYEIVEDARPEHVDYIYENYVARILNLEEQKRERVLNIMVSSWVSNKDHSKIRQWGRACIGLAELLKATSDQEVSKIRSVDIVIRISRWSYGESNFHVRFVPDAGSIVLIIWGSIEDLYRKYR